MKQIRRFLKQSAAITIMAVACGAVMAAPSKTKYEINAGSIVCFSEQAYNDQMAFLSQGIERTIPACGVAGRSIPVVVLDLNMFSVSKVRAADGGMELFVSVEDLNTK